MNLKPLGDRVIIKQDEAEETTASGLYLATEAKEKPQTGTVLAVGEGKLDKDGKLIPVPVKEGDKVLYGKYGGTEITVDGEDVMILRADDLYALCLPQIGPTYTDFTRRCTCLETPESDSNHPQP